MVNRVTLGFLHAMIAAVGLSICAYLYSEFVAYDPPLIYLPGSEVYPKQVRPGELIYVTRKFRVKRHSVIQIVRRMESGDCQIKCVAHGLEPSITTTPSVKNAVEKDVLNKGNFVRTLAHKIPANVDPGFYRLEFDLLWENSIGKTYSLHLPPLEIEVIK